MSKNVVFSQLSNLISPFKFKKICQKYENDKYVKKLSSLEQFKVLLFAQIKGYSSLREIQTGLKSRCSRLFHLGFGSQIKRSTLCDANSKREPAAFRDIFFHLLQRCRTVSPKHKFRFRNDFYSLDSTTISLCLNLCSWAKFRSTKAGVKLHTLLNHKGYVPDYVWIKEAKFHDSKFSGVLNTLKLKSGSILVMDRAYIDFKWFWRLTKDGIFYVTRAKRNMHYKVVGQNPKLKVKGILRDSIIRLCGHYQSKDYPEELRLIRFKDTETGKVYEFLTNNMDLSASTIADCYKERWQIELFFKWIKQYLRIKRFLGRSRKAVEFQIWTALVYYLMLCYLKYLNRWSHTLLMITRTLREMVDVSIPLPEIFRPPDAKIPVKFKNNAQFNLFSPTLTGH